MSQWYITVTEHNKWLLLTYLHYFKDNYPNLFNSWHIETGYFCNLKTGYLFLGSCNKDFHSVQKLSEVPKTHTNLITESQLEALIIEQVVPFKVNDEVFVDGQRARIIEIGVVPSLSTHRENFIVKYVLNYLNDMYYTVNYTLKRNSFKLIEKVVTPKKPKTPVIKDQAPEQILSIAEQTVISLFIKRGINDITHLGVYTRIFEMGMEYQKTLNTNVKSK